MRGKIYFKLSLLILVLFSIQITWANTGSNIAPSSKNVPSKNIKEPEVTIITQQVQKTEKKPYSHEKIDKLKGPFNTPQEVTKTCISCHREEAEELAKTVHWLWKGPASGLTEHKNINKIGKINTINNFCIAIISNWGRCTQCHAGYGWKDATYDFSNLNNIDCLICHEQTGKYKKHPKTAGLPLKGVDLAASAQSVGKPTRRNCGLCHFFAGGGDNVKKGDLGTALINPSPETDIHMGKLNFSCQTCHKTENHIIKGSSLHIGVNSGKLSCEDCHVGIIHEKKTLNDHIKTVACQTCHIPAFSRTQYTKVFWDWSVAGQLDPTGNDIIKKDENGNIIYHSKKGGFKWEKNIRPTYAWWNGKFTRILVGDKYDTVPVNLGSPLGDIKDPDSKIYPFKVMRGIQGADPVTKQILIPHLFGKAGGQNPYWAMWDWNRAFEEGMRTAELNYSGKYEWVETYLYLAINHEVAPKTQALKCKDCHFGGINFKELGYKGDPIKIGGRFK